MLKALLGAALGAALIMPAAAQTTGECHRDQVGYVCDGETKGPNGSTTTTHYETRGGGQAKWSAERTYSPNDNGHIHGIARECMLQYGASCN